MSWPTGRLAEYCEVITKGTTPTTVGHDFRQSGVPFLRAQNVEGGTVNIDREILFIDEDTHRALRRSHVYPGDVLVSIAGTIGRASIVPNGAPPLNCNQAVAIVRTNGDVYRPFLRHWLESSEAQAQIRGAAVTGTISNLSLSQLGNLEVPLPPLAEQRRITEILDKVDTLRNKRRAALAHLDTLTQSIFLDMFGDPITNQRGWREVEIGEICEVKGGKRLPKGEEYSSVPTRFRYIRVTDLRFGAIDESALVYLKPEVQVKIARYVVHTGDVIISIAGSIGLIAPVPASLDGVNLTENAAKLVPRASDVYDAVFLAALLRTRHAQREIGSYVGQVTIGKLALFRIERIRVPVPPIDLQREFSRRIARISQQTAVQRMSLLQLHDLFASLQHRAFRGEL